MWDVPRYRIRAYVRALKRSRAQRKEAPEFLMHLRRVKAQVRIIEGLASSTLPSPARLVLNELTPLGTYVFTRSPFREGQILELAIEEPRLFYVKGRVIGCEKTNNESVIISEDPVPYRVAVAFEFHSLYEREMVKLFIHELKITDLYPRGDKGAA